MTSFFAIPRSSPTCGGAAYRLLGCISARGHYSLHSVILIYEVRERANLFLVHQTGHLDEARHDWNQGILDLSFHPAQGSELWRRVLGRLLEFHEQIFRHRQLEAGMSDKAKRFWTNLENRRAAIIALGQNARIGGRFRSIAHENDVRIPRRQIPIEGVVSLPGRVANPEGERRGTCLAVCGDAENLRAKADTDHRLVHH